MFWVVPPEKLSEPEDGAARSWKMAMPAVAPVVGAVRLSVVPPLTDTVP